MWLWLIDPGAPTIFWPPISNEKDLPQLLDIVRPLAKSAPSIFSLTALFSMKWIQRSMPWQPGHGTTSGLLYYQTMTWMINTIGFEVIQQSVYGQNFKCVQELIWYAPNALYEIGQQKRTGSFNKNKRMNNNESWRLMLPKKDKHFCPFEQRTRILSS